MGRTRLFQQAGSPLIQGHSRTQRPFLADWFSGYLAAVATAGVGMTAWGLYSGNIFNGGLIDAVFEVANLSFVLFGPGAFLGAGLGVGLGRRLGARHPWRIGWVVGVIAGVVSIYVVIAVIA